MPLKPGSLSDFSNSMAAAIEQAFQSEWNANKDIPLGDDDTDRKIMFAAIAQGVVRHLQDELNGSLNIDVSVTQISGNNIASSSGSVSVTQNSGGGNRVISEGSITSLELLSE